MLSVGGIPARTTLCATINASGGDDTNAINAAIGNCPAGQVVSLGAGTFTIGEGNLILLNKGITLRGQGAGKTTLQRTGGAVFGSGNPGSNPTPIIYVSPAGRYTTSYGAGTALTADALQGQKSIQVANTTGFAVGHYALIDELSGAAWQPDPNVNDTGLQVWASPPDDSTCSKCYRVTYSCHNPQTGYDHCGQGYTPSGGCWFSNCDRPTNEIKKIAAISGNTITFDDPIIAGSYRVNHSALIYSFTTSLLENAGVEALTVSNGDDSNITFNFCAYCWAQNVENTVYLNDGFRLVASFRVQLEGVYIHKAAWPQSGGAGYNLSLAWGDSEILVENSISVLANKVDVVRSSGAGSVFAYNYFDDGYTQNLETWIEIGANATHMVGGHHILFEGNESFNLDNDNTWGGSSYITYFRNYAPGYRKTFAALSGHSINDATGCCGPLRAAGDHTWQYWHSFIGNVLGTPGAMSGWTYNCGPPKTGIPSSCVWDLGIEDRSDGTHNYGWDPNVPASAIQDGNYDFLTSSVQWAVSDTTHTLPNSLYLTQTPAFFNAGKGYPWPWVNPTGAPVLCTLPAKARYDAGTPFAQP
jgi:hypothetical protein